MIIIVLQKGKKQAILALLLNKAIDFREEALISLGLMIKADAPVTLCIFFVIVRLFSFTTSCYQAEFM